jgi:hypothetical protein
MEGSVNAKAQVAKRHHDSIRQIEVIERADAKGAWMVEAIGSGGEVYQAIFSGPEAEGRAKEYATLKYRLK